MSEVIRVTVPSIEEVAKRMSMLGSEWQDIAFKSLGETLQTENVMGAIRKRTPRSELTSKWNLYVRKDGSVRRKIDTDRPRKDGYVPGMNNLRNDLKFYSPMNTPGSRSFELGFKNVPYARAVHQMDASSKGKAINWTTAGTGSHFVSGPVEKAKDWIPGNISTSIEFMMRRKGII